MKRPRHLRAPNTLQSGHYIFWQQRTYQVLALEDERRAKARGESMSRKQAIRRALSTVNKTTIRMEVRGTLQDIPLHAGLTSYYKYERLYDTYHGDEAQIASSFRRSTFRLP